MSYRFADRLRYIPLLCVQWKTPADGQRNCPKYVEFYSKNKFEKLVHLVGFIIRSVCQVSASLWRTMYYVTEKQVMKVVHYSLLRNVHIHTHTPHAHTPHTHTHHTHTHTHTPHTHTHTYTHHTHTHKHHTQVSVLTVFRYNRRNYCHVMLEGVIMTRRSQWAV